MCSNLVESKVLSLGVVYMLKGGGVNSIVNTSIFQNILLYYINKYDKYYTSIITTTCTNIIFIYLCIEYLERASVVSTQSIFIYMYKL